LDVYVKLINTTSLYGRSAVRLSDIAEVYAPKDRLGAIRDIVVRLIDREEKRSYVVSIIDVISALSKDFPSATVQSVGETSSVIRYTPKRPTNNAIWRFTKVAFVTLMLFCGAMTAIMSFQTDASMPKVFEGFVTALIEPGANAAIIQIPYAIGLGVGILIFFNHFFTKRITDDPTPIEVEMTAYEIGVSDMISSVDAHSRLKDGEK